MADAVVLVVILGLLITLVLGVSHLYNLRIGNQRRTLRATHVEVLCTHDNELPIRVGEPIALSDPEFETAIALRRSEAQYRIAALNASQKGWRLEEHGVSS